MTSTDAHDTEVSTASGHLAPKDLVPVTVLTGFRGAGKTTLLNQLLTGEHGRKIAVLINDFGEINIDADLVVGVDDEMVSLANGCVCCEVRDDLVAATIALLERDIRPDHIVLEASGVAEPMSLAMTFSQEMFAAQLQLDGIITVLDCEQFLDVPDLMEHKLRQIVCADLVVLNKTDLVSPQRANEVQAWINNRVHRIRYVPAIYGDVPLEVLLGLDRAVHTDLAHDDQHGHDDNDTHGAQFTTASFITTAPLDPQRLMSVARGLPGSVYRMKGVVSSTDEPHRRSILQVVGRRASITPGVSWDQIAPSTRIVMIGANNMPADDIVSLLRGCEVTGM
jgi:G3E family GTPase